MRPPDRFVLHPSVAVRWWLYHLPYAPEADRFLHDIVVGAKAGLVAVAEVELVVLDLVAADLGALRFDPDLARLLCDDILRHFRLMTASGHLTTISPDRLVRSAFSIASHYAVPLGDALTVILAELQGMPLIVADEPVYQNLQVLARERQRPAPLWLPDYLRDL